MNILAVDTTGEPLSLALLARGKVYRFHKILKKPHDETLLEKIDRLLERAKLSLEELDAVAAASGPGRFTGIRIGMTYAAVAAGALKKKALAISRLEAAARKGKGALVAAVVPGWREEKFYQLFKNGAPEGEPVWTSPAAWPAQRAELLARGAELVETDPTAEDLLPAAEAALRAKRKRVFEPLYLKPAGYEAKRPSGAAR